MTPPPLPATCSVEAPTFDAIYDAALRGAAFPWRRGYRSRVLDALCRISKSDRAKDEWDAPWFASFKGVGLGTLTETIRFIASMPGFGAAK